MLKRLAMSSRKLAGSLVRFGTRLSLAATQILVVGLMIWFLLRLYPGDRWLLVRLGSYFAPWLFMALLPGLVIALLGRRRLLAAGTLLMLLLLGGSYWPLLVPEVHPVRAETAADQLRVMSFNVHFANREAGRIAGLIEAQNPDIIALQELTPELNLLLQPELAAEYPYILLDDSSGFLMAVISRYPLAARPTPAQARRVQQAVVETPAGLVTVWNVHPSTALHQGGWEFQKKALTAVAAEIEQEPGPVIVLGDFNTTDRAENYRLIAGRLTDVYRAAGYGFGFTFPEPGLAPAGSRYAQLLGLVRPAFRIDHIFASHHFLPQEAQVIPGDYGSDHRPLVATLRMAF